MSSSMNSSPNYEAGDLNDLLEQSKQMSYNFLNLSLKDRNKSYPDAIEQKRSGLFVQNYQEFIGWDKENGFKVRTPLNATYVFDKSGEKQ